MLPRQVMLVGSNCLRGLPVTATATAGSKCFNNGRRDAGDKGVLFFIDPLLVAVNRLPISVAGPSGHHPSCSKTLNGQDICVKHLSPAGVAGGFYAAISDGTIVRSRNSCINDPIRSTSSSNAKWPVSRRWSSALGISLFKSSAPSTLKIPSFLPHVISVGG